MDGDLSILIKGYTHQFTNIRQHSGCLGLGKGRDKVFFEKAKHWIGGDIRLLPLINPITVRMNISHQ